LVAASRDEAGDDSESRDDDNDDDSASSKSDTSEEDTVLKLGAELRAMDDAAEDEDELAVAGLLRTKNELPEEVVCRWSFSQFSSESSLTVHSVDI
jgi:hypothetical protein